MKGHLEIFKMDKVDFVMWTISKAFPLLSSPARSMTTSKITHGCNAQFVRTGFTLTVLVWSATGRPKISFVDATFHKMCTKYIMLEQWLPLTST